MLHFTSIKKYTLPIFFVLMLFMYGGIVVFAIAPGQTLDPVGDSLCTGPTDVNCVINLYESLDSDSVLYLDGNGNLTTDTLFTRDSVTNETRIGVIQSGGLDLAEFKTDSDILDMGIEGVVLSRGDIAGIEGFSFMGAVDLSPFVGMSRFGTIFYAEDFVSGDQSMTLVNPNNILISSQNSAGVTRRLSVESSTIRLQVGDASSDDISVQADYGTGPGTGSASMRYRSNLTERLLILGSEGLRFSSTDPHTPGFTYVFPLVDGTVGQSMITNGAGTLSWGLTPAGSPITIGTSGDTLYSSGLTGTGQGDTTIGNNIFLGNGAGSAAISASNSNFLGYESGLGASGASNSNFFGQSAGNGATNAAFSNFLGFNAGNGATNATNANFIGQNAGRNATSASNSNFLGNTAGNGATGANHSNFLGNLAGNGATDAYLSNFLGNLAGYGATDAAFSNFFGSGAGSGATNANNSTFIGYQAGASNAIDTGSQNSNNSIFIGNNAGYQVADFGLDNSTGGTSILIGDDTSTGGFSNSIGIGEGATNTATNQFMIGSITSAINTVRIQGSLIGTQCTITTGTGIACTSDERLKTNIVDIDTATILEKLSNIRTVNYNLIGDLSNRNQVGFLAQNLEQYFPELVDTNSDGYKSVYYAQMTPILTKAIQELDLKLSVIESQTITQGGFSVSSLFNGIKDWLGDMGNGIERFFAKEIHTEQICIAKSDGTDFCINGDQLESIMNGSTNQIIYTSGNNNQNDADDVNHPIINEQSGSEENMEIIESGINDDSSSENQSNSEEGNNITESESEEDLSSDVSIESGGDDNTGSDSETNIDA